jgi:hypothetical protein
MLAKDSLQVRRSAIAYVFQDTVQLDRSMALKFNEQLNSDGEDFPEMRHNPAEVVLSRGTAPRTAEIHVGGFAAQTPQGGPAAVSGFRFLVADSESAKPIKFFCDLADTAHDAFNMFWGGRGGRLVMVEVAISATMELTDAPNGAAAHLLKELAHMSDPAQSALGRPVNHFALRLGSGLILAPESAPVKPPLGNAQVDLAFESFPADPRLVIVNMVVKWPAIDMRLRDTSVPVEMHSQLSSTGTLEMNQKAEKPSAYIDQSFDYISKNVVSFLRSSLN